MNRIADRLFFEVLDLKNIPTEIIMEQSHTTRYYEVPKMKTLPPTPGALAPINAFIIYAVYERTQDDCEDGMVLYKLISIKL